MNPFIPTVMPRVAIVDYRADESVIENIKKYNIDVIKSQKCLELQEQVDGHPDMVLHPVDRDTVVVAPNVFDYYQEALIPYGIKVIKGGKTLTRNYPDDIAYNVARISKFAIHNTRYTDEVLKDCLQKSDIEFIHVNQGYTKCSTTAVRDNSAITSDIVIYRRLEELGVECLYIDPENIHLEGFEYGFIGGATGALTPDIFMLTGNIKNEAVKQKLYSFIEKDGYKIVLGCDNILTDLGTVIVL